MSASHISSELHNQPQPVLRIHLLGPPTVVWDDQSLHIPRRMVRALLYRLAYSEQSVSRQHLHLLLWPDHPEEIARRNLSHHLTHLRKSLPCPHALISRGDQICLNREFVLCDVVQFKQVMVAENRDITGIQKAIDGYHGPLLEGFDLPGCAEFEHWTIVERNLLERLYLEGLDFLVNQFIDQGSISEAIRHAQLYLETEELSEQMHCILIELLAAKGDRRGALDQFEICTAVLERELGVNPLPETRAVYQAVLHGQSRFPQPIRLKPSPKLPAQKMPLVGRSQAIQVLDSLLSRCQEQGGQVVLISGEAGIGKSRLMQEFADQYQNKMKVLFGFAHRGESTIPYHPIVVAFRLLLLDNALDNDGKSGVKGKPSSWLEKIEPIWLAEISRLLPELRAKIPNLAAPLVTDAETARTRLFEALGNLLKSLTANGKPVILCLDDLQWSDGSTQAWLVHLSEMMRQSSLCVFILGSYRSDEVDQVRDLRRSISRLGILTELELPGLSEKHVCEFICNVIGDRTGLEILAKKLHKATGGNPYFLTETLRTLLEVEKLGGDLSMAELPLPESVREAIKARIQRLDAKHRQVMEAGAVLGYTFTFDLLQLTAGRSELETMDCLDELAARQLVLEQGAEFSFIHELTQRTVVEGLHTTRRRLLHLRAGKAYLRARPEANVQLAYHFENGGDTYNAIKYHGLAAQRAHSIFAWIEAEFHQGKMLDLLEQIDPQSTQPEYLRQRGRILADRAHNRFLQNRLSERDADLLILEQLAGTSGDEHVGLISILERVVALSYSGKYSEAISLAEEGLVLAEQLDDRPARLRLLAQTGLAHYFLGQPHSALCALEPALKLSKEGKDLETRVDISQFLGHVHYHLGNYKESLVNHQEAYNCSSKIGDRGGMAWSLMNLGLLKLKLCQWEESKQNLEEGLSLARQTGIHPAEGYAFMLLGQWDLYRGNYSEAIDYFTKAMPIHQIAQSEHMVVITEEMSGMAFYHLGDLERSRQSLERATDRARSIGFRRLLCGALSGLGMVEISARCYLQACAYLTEAIKLARKSACAEYQARALTNLSQAKRLIGELTEALKCATDAEKIALENDLVVNQMWAHLEAGLSLLEQGKQEKALERAQQAVALVGQAHEGWWGSEHVYLGYAKVLRAVGQIQLAEEQEAMADEIIRAKAERFEDLEQRLQFMQRYQDRTY